MVRTIGKLNKMMPILLTIGKQNRESYHFNSECVLFFCPPLYFKFQTDQLNILILTRKIILQEKLLKVDPKPKEVTSLRPVKSEMSLLEKKRQQSLKLINNLARQKFGSPRHQGSLQFEDRPNSVQSFR